MTDSWLPDGYSWRDGERDGLPELVFDGMVAGGVAPGLLGSFLAFVVDEELRVQWAGVAGTAEAAQDLVETHVACTDMSGWMAAQIVRYDG